MRSDQSSRALVVLTGGEAPADGGVVLELAGSRQADGNRTEDRLHETTAVDAAR